MSVMLQKIHLRDKGEGDCIKPVLLMKQPSVPFNDLFDHFFWNHTKGDRLYFSKGLSPERFCLLQIYMYSDRQSKSFQTTQR